MRTKMRCIEKLLAVSLVAVVAITPNVAFADKTKYAVLGGVNLNYYCKTTFGAQFKSILVGPTAGDWTCQRNQNDRREISVQNACRLQYGRTDLKAKATDWNNPLSWVCLQLPKPGK